MELAPLVLTLEGERLRSHRLIDLVFTNGQIPDEIRRNLELISRTGSVGWTALFDDEEQPENRIQFASKQEMHAEVDRLFDEQLAIAAKPVSEQRAAAAAYDAAVKQMPPSQPIAKATGGAGVAFLRRAAYRQAVEIDATRLLLAIYAFQALKGKWPATLEDVVPDFLASIPVDVTNGKSFGYKPPIAPNQTFTLYMYGVDGEDNGGVLREDHESHAFRESSIGLGYDYIINHPRSIREGKPAKRPSGVDASIPARND